MLSRIVPSGRRSPRLRRVPVRLDSGATARADVESRNYRRLLAGMRDGLLSQPGQAPWGASGRRQRPWGAGGRLRNAGRRAGAVHAPAGWAAQPSTGGRGNSATPHQPMGCRPLPHTLANPARADTNHTRAPPSAPKHPDFHHAEIMSVPCPKGMRKACRTRGGWLTLGVNSDMRRHGELAPKGSQPHTPQGSGCAAARGWF